MPRPFELPDFFRQKFEYTTLARARARGLPNTTDPGPPPQAISDANALLLIQDASKVINTITRQWFQAVEASVRVSGDGRVAALPNFIPFLQIDDVFLGEDQTNDVRLDPIAYINKGRWVERRSINLQDTRVRSLNPDLLEQRNFPAFAHGVRLDGVFGWLDETTTTRRVDGGLGTIAAPVTTTPVVAGATIVTVDDASVFEVPEQLTLRDASNPGVFRNHWIESIAANALTVWPPVEFAVGLTEIVRSYGRVPAQIERAVQFVMAALLAEYTDGIFGTGGTGTEGSLDDQVVEERTDNYEYKLRGAFGGGGGGGGLTEVSPSGSRRADMILSKFLSPPILVAV